MEARIKDNLSTLGDLALPFNFGSRVLILLAHPDDEVLSCGGTIARLTEEGAEVHVSFFADGVFSRDGDAGDREAELCARREAARKAGNVLGAASVAFGDLPDNQMDTVPLLQVIREVERLVDRHRPDTVVTHHAGDLNVDHRTMHKAVVTACRPQPGQGVRRILFGEVASSTEWQTPNSAAPFVPNLFVDISTTLERKLAALRAYEGELRPWPHARSLDAVEHHDRWRGATVGMEAAEAFVLGRLLIR